MIDLGTVRPGSTIRIPFSTFDSNDPQASAAITGYVVGDIRIYKDGSTTERASTAGYTATTSFDTLVGINEAVIDLSDNTTAGFYAAGSEYVVVVADVTLDAATVRKAIGRFTIGYPDAIINTTIATLASQTSFTLTAGPAEDDALNGSVVCIHDVASAVQIGYAVVSDYTGSTKTVTLTAGTTFTASATDNVSFYPPANTNWVQGTAQTANDNGADINTLVTRVVGTIAAGTHNPQSGDAYAIVNNVTYGNAQLVRSTTPANTLDVTAGGTAGINWGNIENPTAVVDLSSTDMNLVDNVTLVATTTTNSDMRGTDNALLASSAPTNWSATAITATGAYRINWAGIENTTTVVDLSGTDINLVDTCTTNTDMRGTDGANTVVPDAAGVAPTAVEIRQEMDANSTRLSSIALDTGTTLPALIDDLAVKKNTAFPNFEFLMVLTSDHVTPATGLTVTGQRSIDGGAFVSVSGSIAEVSNGIYQFDAVAADTNGDLITWRFTSATADDTFVTFKTVA